MKEKIHYLKIKIIFVFAIIALLALSYLSYIRINHLIEESKLVNHTNLVKLSLEKTFAALSDKESNNREYIFTNDSVFFASYFAADALLKSELNTIDSLTKGNPSQQQKVTVLRTAIAERIEMMEHNLALFQTQKVSISDRLKGKALMESVRAQIDKMQTEEDKLLSDYSVSLSESTFITPLFTIVSIIASLVLLIASYFKIVQGLKISYTLKANIEQRTEELLQANKELSFQNEEKEKRAAELIIANYARSLLEASLDPLVTISAEGKITDVNAASIKVTGIAREELIGTDFSSCFTEPKKAQEGYLQVFEKGFVSDYPLTIKHKDGTLTDVLYNASVYKDNKGNVLGVFAAARDVTLQKQVEDELLKTQERLNAGLKIANIALSEISYMTNTVQLSPESAAMYGFPENQLEATRQQMHDTFHPAVKAELEAQILLAMNPDNGGYMALEHPVVLPSGEVRWLKVNKQFFYDHSTQTAKPVYSILVSQDITERKESSQYARSLIEANLDPLVTISADGKITDVNAATIKVTGIAREKLIGTDFSHYFTEPKKAQEGYLQVFEKGYVSDYPLTIKHKDGNLTDVLYNASVYKDSIGNVLGVFAAARDVTEQKWAKDLRIANKELSFQNKEKEKRAAELVAANKELAFQNEEKEKRAAELVAANKELESFTYISSHDLQEPLRQIQNFASRIIDIEKQNLSDKGKDYFERMNNAANRMQTLIADLLAYSRATTAERIFETTDLNQIVEQVKIELREIIDEKHAIIEIGEMCEARVIPFQFRQLIHNLIGNSLKFSIPGVPPLIKISGCNITYSKIDDANLVLGKEYCHISISDNGIGFEPEYKDRIFEVFQRLHDKQKIPGTGIGLAIVKKIVDNHNGSITATSQLNKGATFDVYIPIN